MMGLRWGQGQEVDRVERGRGALRKGDQRGLLRGSRGSGVEVVSDQGDQVLMGDI